MYVVWFPKGQDKLREELRISKEVVVFNLSNYSPSRPCIESDGKERVNRTVKSNNGRITVVQIPSFSTVV